MKWFHHRTDAIHSEKLNRLIAEFGFEGYGRFWRILELIAERMDKTNRCHLEMTEAEWCRYLLIRRPLLHRYLVVISQIFDIKTVINGLIIRIEYRNLLNYRDNHTKRSVVTLKQLQSKEIEIDIERKEKEKEKKEKETDARTPSENATAAEGKIARRNPKHPDFDNTHFEKVWADYPSKDGKKAAERHYRASVKSETDRAAIETALKNYIAHVNRRRADFPGLEWKNGSTWFNNWRDWVNRAPPETPRQNQLAI